MGIQKGAADMCNNEVQIVRLEPMCVAAVCVQGESPEGAAWRKLATWAAPRGLLADPAAHPVFGFDNPPPAAAGDIDGYEFWIRVDPDMPPDKSPDDGPDSGIVFKGFDGGLYAVITCAVRGDPWQTITAAWQRLEAWLGNSQYAFGSHQHLEKHRNPGAPLRDLVLDLYCPIQKDV